MSTQEHAASSTGQAAEPIGPGAATSSAAQGATFDAGLRAYMLQVYNFMGLSLGLTGLVAYGTYRLAVTSDLAAAALVDGRPALIQSGLYLTDFGQAFFSGALFIAVLVSPLVAILLLFLAMRFARNAVITQALFWSVSVLFGLGLSAVFVTYTETSIVKVFFITAATFGALSLYGYTTRRDLADFGAFLFMGLTGVLIASLVNLIFRSSWLDFGLSIIAVGVFAGMTAYDTQMIKNRYLAADGSRGVADLAMMSALELYLDFLNLFLQLLKLIGELKKGS
jgi:hypothetical protein